MVERSDTTGPQPSKPLHLGRAPVLGTIDKLSDAEQGRYMGCEAVIGMGWHTYVDVGLALAQIRNERLYREEFDMFEACCQAKWAYGRRYVNQLISAAQLVKHLGAISSLQKPAPPEVFHCHGSLATLGTGPTVDLLILADRISGDESR